MPTKAQIEAAARAMVDVVRRHDENGAKRSERYFGASYDDKPAFARAALRRAAKAALFAAESIKS